MLANLIILVAIAIGHAEASKYAGDDLVALCDNKDIDLTKLSQLDSLSRKLDDDLGEQCNDRTKAAIRDLNALVKDNNRVECSMKAYNNYRSFYLNYLDTSEKAKARAAADVPGPIRKFALAYGVQVSALCRINMVNELLDKGAKAVSKEDYDQLDMLIGEKGPIDQALGFNSKRPDDMVLPSDFMIVFSSVRNKKTGQIDDDGAKKIPFQLKATPFIKRVQTICERRFRPVYAPLMFPVSRMANLGFDYRKSLLAYIIKRAEKKDEPTRGVVGQWTRIVFICEALAHVELVEEAQDAEQSEGNTATHVRVVDKDRAAEVKEAVDGRDLLANAQANLDDIQWVVFEPNQGVDLPDTIYGTAGQKKAVRKVNTNRSEAMNIKIRFVVKIMRKFANALAGFKPGSALYTLYKETTSSLNAIETGKAGSDVQTKLVKSMNELIEREFNPDVSVSAHIEYESGTERMCRIICAVVVVIIIVGALIAIAVTLTG